MRRAVLRTDGGARGNPGPAGAGIVLEVEDGATVRAGRYLGVTTNNVAEYEALVWGLENARALGVGELAVYADSELVVRQLTGEYRVKNPGLKPLHERALSLMRSFDRVEVRYVPREENRAADEMANAAMDAHGPVGDAAVWPEDIPEQGALF